MDYVIHYEVPPLQEMRLGTVIAGCVDEAVAAFRKAIPNGRVRQINGLPVTDDGETVKKVAR